TIPLGEAARRSGNIRQLSVAGLIAEAIRRVSNEDSVSAMFH
ncbi:MAG: ribose-phosphate pyrophosphokinase, partial [Halomonas sp.]|nr:ribose-phosphate pyrophosphokinase [Halomonas sp.]